LVFFLSEAKMKAYQIGKSYGINSLFTVDIGIPRVKPTQVLIEMKSVSLNYRDILVVNGVWKPPVGRIPTSDGVGVVLDVGSEVKDLKVGDRVVGLFFPNWVSGKPDHDKLQGSPGGMHRDGMLQEKMVLEEKEVIKVPSYLSDQEASSLPCAALAAWHALMEHDPIREGETILIQGTGSVSLFTLQFALLQGANPIVISASDEKLERVRNLGVKHTFNYKENLHWEKSVVKLTSGRGVDRIVEVVGGNNLNKSIEMVAMAGTISVVGLLGGFIGEIDTGNIMEKNIRLQGVLVGSREMFVRMNETLESRKLHPVIDCSFPFEEAIEAFNHQEKGNHFGKVCISV
jgi:NADPH:quinone reductase-like Zn-dependent oxidoreductase